MLSISNRSSGRRSLFACALALCLILPLLSSCQLARVVRYNFADITDHAIFPNRPLQPSAQPFRFHQTETPRYAETFTDSLGVTYDLEEHLRESDTVALLIVHRDTVHYERYLDGYEAASTVASFSMTKSVFSLLFGIAVDRGIIPSVEEPVTRYVPELAAHGFETVTLRHLLQMTSGLRFNEDPLNPLGQAASLYYGTSLREQMAKLRLEHPPGTRFHYASGSTQLLGLALERALDGGTMTEFLQEAVWTPLQMEYPASWTVDWSKPPLEKTFCCLNGAAGDFAKIGRLYARDGDWDGTQIVSKAWIAESTRVDTTEGSIARYQYQWWRPFSEEDALLAQGLLGQYIYVDRARDVVIVRLGHTFGPVRWQDIFRQLASYYE